MANLELTVGSPFRPIIDGIISKTGLPTPYGWTGTEYVGFTKQEMYVAGTKPVRGTSYIAYDWQEHDPMPCCSPKFGCSSDPRIRSCMVGKDATATWIKIEPDNSANQLNISGSAGDPAGAVSWYIYKAVGDTTQVIGYESYEGCWDFRVFQDSIDPPRNDIVHMHMDTVSQLRKIPFLM